MDGFEREWDLDCDLLQKVSEKQARETLEASLVKEKGKVESLCYKK